MPYSGGKQVIATRIAGLMPPHRGYVEPFAGAMSAGACEEAS
jgi:site-specific DNA-adenine methylase